MSLCDYQSPGSCGCVREAGHPGYCWCTDCEDSHEFGRLHA